jgi:site-specific DNA recombinase
MNTRAVTYARVSGDDRGREGRNLAGQVEMCREYALQQGWIIVAELAEDDRGASGAAFELPQLNKVREMARNKEFDVLVVREIDRLSRKLAKQLVVEEELSRMGVAIVYVLADYANSPEGRLSKHIRATIAEYEREKIMERMIRGRLLKVRAGHVLVHSTPPYGYKVEKNDAGKTTLVADEDEARIVRAVFDWYVNGYNGERITIGGIAKKLTEMGVPTRLDTLPRSGGSKKRGWAVWGRSSVAKILKSEVYIGKWYYRKDNHSKEEWLPIDVPPLISEELWFQTRKIGERNKALGRANRKHQYLLTGHIWCGLCGSRMNGHPGFWTSKNASGYNLYYRCTAHDGTKANLKCSMPQFRLEPVDDAVWHWITDFLTNPQELEQGMADYQAEQEVKNERVIERVAIIDELLADHQAQLNRVLDLYLGGEFPKEMLVEKKTRLEETIRSLENEKLDLIDFVEKKSLSPEQYEDIQEFSRKILEGINLISCEFETKRRIIELLDLQVVCMIDEDGNKFVNLKCILGSDQYDLSTGTGGRTWGGLAGWRGRRRWSSGSTPRSRSPAVPRGRRAPEPPPGRARSGGCRRARAQAWTGSCAACAARCRSALRQPGSACRLR